MIYCPYCNTAIDDRVYRPSFFLNHFSCKCKCCALAFKDKQIFYFKIFIFTGSQLYYLYTYAGSGGARLTEISEGLSGSYIDLPVNWSDLSLWDPIELAKQINTVLAFQ